MLRATSHNGAEANAIRLAMRRCRGIFLAVGLFSGVLNVLALTGSLYMLQVYDRVLPSRSIPTLIGLSLLMIGLYAGYGLLDFFRVRAMARVGFRIDRQLRDKVFALVRLLPLRARGGDGLQPIRDLDQIRGFLSGLGPTALFDIPWIPVYLTLIFLLHPLLGLVATGGAIVIVGLTLLTEVTTSAHVRRAATSGAQRMALGETARRNAEVIHALGMGGHIGRKWIDINAHHMNDQLRAADAASGIGSATKIFRMMLQSGMLGLGAYLVIRDQMTAGSIIAASITTSRALAPVEIAISHWRSFISARQGYARLSTLLQSYDFTPRSSVELRAPSRSMSVEGLTIAPPGETRPVIRNISFAVVAGQSLGIIGPTGAGKSVLARALVGAWTSNMPPSSVRLDGASLDQWRPDALGRHIGYLPQHIELLDGTIAENIARFDPDASSEKVIAAADQAGVHDLIVGFENGYETRIGEAGMRLSGGQRQRIALARALYGDPFLVVLDEPNSNLDIAGDQALAEAIRSIRERKGIVIVIAHRPSALAGVETLLAMSNGQAIAFGPKDEVLRKVTLPSPPAIDPTTIRPGAMSLKVVKEST